MIIKWVTVFCFCVTFYSKAQVNTVLKNNYMDFFMATTTFGVEQNVRNTVSVQLCLGYTYAETFGIYDARNLRGGLFELQIRRYLIPGKQQSLSHVYFGGSLVHRFASYLTDEGYYLNNQYVEIKDIKAKANYFSFGGIVGYQLPLLKNKLLWDNYFGVCGRIGSGYKPHRAYSHEPENMIFQLSYSGIAPKFGTAFCLVIR
ncbi:MAG: DUF3575 domain-containing protein [Bacteroidia bacterium]|nr:DUF3575 domain-containing protein [Bacteroidia bacterium]MDW8348391.1 DUF3575 domain-containing protein [Bacteroidia bacterium]